MVFIRFRRATRNGPQLNCTTAATWPKVDMSIGLLFASVASIAFIFSNKSVFPLEKRHLAVNDLSTGTSRYSTANVLNSTTTVTATTDKPKARIPTVLLAGAQKASTTSLAKYLMKIPNMCFAKDGQQHEDNGKESHFFDMLYDGGLTALQKLYQNCSDDSILIDGTPATMVEPDRVRAIYEEQGTVHELKIIFILREPVAREISWYNHKARNADLPQAERPFWADDVFQPNGTVKSFIQVQRETVFQYFKMKRHDSIRGYYAHWLKKWSQHFDRQTQILVLSYEELKRDPAALLQRVHAFLDLPPTKRMRLSRENSDGKKSAPPSCKDQREFAEYFKRPNAQLYNFMRRHPGPPMEQRPFPMFGRKCIDPK